MTLNPIPTKVAFYQRVSTGRQAEADLSIPDQERQISAYCAQQGWTQVASFTDAGLSATDDRRPEFQRMIDAATGPDRPFDVIAVHTLSRFFRDQFQCELYIRKLHRAGVRVISITQAFEDNPTGELIRRILGSFDDYPSRENAKHTLRSMQENARQGFWNGSKPPFGYATEDAGQRGVRTKKRLVIHEDEAAVVRRIYDLALGREGPVLGIKAIVSRLNGAGLRMRGKPFHIAAVHRILTSTTHAGMHVFNRRQARDGRLKPPEEWDTVAVPAIIAAEALDAVRAHLAARRRSKAPPRRTGSSTLLTGIARCGFCGSGMTLRTGKGRRYRYDTWAGRAQKGATCCQGRAITMAALDGMVMEHLADRLFTPARLREVLEAHLARDAADDAARGARLAHLRRQRTEIQGGIGRLLDLVAQGVLTAHDASLASKLQALREKQASVERDISLIAQASRASGHTITPDRIRRFAEMMRDALTNGDPEFRKAYLRLFVDQITVGEDAVHVTGSAAAISHALVHADKTTEPRVPSFISEWRPRRDSNSRPQD